MQLPQRRFTFNNFRVKKTKEKTKRILKTTGLVGILIGLVVVIIWLLPYFRLIGGQYW